MPRYDYRCPGCGERREVSHSMNDRPTVTCSCGRPMRKVIGACGIIIAGGLSKSRVIDSMKKEGDMRAELKHDYGIEKISPLNGATTADVYNDVKSQGTFVTDKMALSKQRNEERRLAKLKEWKPKAQKRASKRREEMRQGQLAADSAKRAIRL